jgi:hypothetical protein
MVMASITEGLVLRLPTAAQGEQRTAAQAILFAFRIYDSEIAFDPERTILTNGNFC